jgi:hypothetical protein
MRPGAQVAAHDRVLIDVADAPASLAGGRIAADLA